MHSVNKQHDTSLPRAAFQIHTGIFQLRCTIYMYLRQTHGIVDCGLILMIPVSPFKHTLEVEPVSGGCPVEVSLHGLKFQGKLCKFLYPISDLLLQLIPF